MTFFFRFATFFSLLLCLKAFGLESFAELSSAQQISWTKLMHFSLVNGRYRPQIQSAAFYLLENGKESLEEEFAENFRKFRSESDYICKFPARAVFLSVLTSQPAKVCLAVEEWKSKVSAASISLVYVSQYVSNPASVFGHTFLLVNSDPRPAYLNLTVNNAADIPKDTSGLDYMILGLGGGFKSENYLENLAVKAQEYSNIENRDMWVYDLDLSSAEVNQLLNHLWELHNNSKENYYFLTGNCSSYLMNMLAAVLPDIEFQNPHAAYFLPVSSTKKIHNRVRTVKYFPALRSQVSQKLAQTTAGDKKKFQIFLNEPDFLKPEEESAEYLETIIFYYDFLKSKKGGVLGEAESHIYNQALLERSHKGQIVEPPAPPLPARPDFSYEPIRAAVNLISNRMSTFSFAPFFHGSLQKHNGFIPFSEVVVLDSELTLLESRPRLVKETFLALSNFVPSLAFDNQYSWKFALSLQNQNTCFDCYQMHFPVKLGKSFEALQGSLFYVLAGVDISSTYIPVKAEVGMMAEYGSFRYGVACNMARNIDSQVDTDVTLRLNREISTNSDIEVLLKWTEVEVSSHTKLSYFF